MDTIFEDWEVLNFSENYIKQLHKILLQYSAKDEHHKGNYKTISNTGGRLFVEYLSAPQTNVQIINERLDGVQFFIQESARRERLRELFKKLFIILLRYNYQFRCCMLYIQYHYYLIVLLLE